MQLLWIDIIIIGIIGLSALTGLFRGAVKEIIALAIWVAAIWLAYNYSQSLTPWLQRYIQDQSARTIVAFLIILFGVLFAGGIINTILSFILKRTGLNGTDKILGMGFGFLRGVFIVSLILATVQMTSLPYKQYTQNSQLCAQLQPVVTWISGYIPVFIKHVKAADNGKISNLIDTVPQL